MFLKKGKFSNTSFQTDVELGSRMYCCQDRGDKTGEYPDRFTKAIGEFIGSKKQEWAHKTTQNETLKAAATTIAHYMNNPKDMSQDLSTVKTLQTHLKTLGYDLGNSGKNKDGVDGALGSKTAEAIEHFKADHTEELLTAIKADIKSKNTKFEKNSPQR
jgi:hypothetical protein